MKNIILAVVVLTTTLFVGCSSDDNTSEEVAQPKKAIELNAKVKEVSHFDAKIVLQSKNSTQLSYVLLKADETITVEKVLETGTSLKLQQEQEIHLDNLLSNISYTLFVAGKGEDNVTKTISVKFNTLEEPSKILALKDGFAQYDDLDEATGTYRTNFIMSDKKMSEGNKEGYIDVLVWMHTQNPLEKSKQGTYNLPYGILSPMVPDFNQWKPMMYYIGKHIKGNDGKPNFQGTTWIVYDKDNKEEYFVADDVVNTKIEIVKNDDASYTIFGKLVDKTKGKELEFTFTDSKPIFAW